MKKYFTKEYIKECDCKIIQNLNSKIQEGDYLILRIVKNGNPHITLWVQAKVPTKYKYKCRENIIWLPTGDQSAEEIVKILQDKKHRVYDLCYKTMTCNCPVTKCFIYKDEDIYTYTESPNPLIAKIKLLKELLNEK